MHETEVFIIIKDRKEYFPNKRYCRLIKIRKVILDTVNNTVQSKTSVNQWKETSPVIEQLINIKNMECASFMVFHIESFYSLLPKDLFKNVIQFAKESVSQYLWLQSITDQSSTESTII